MHEVSGSGVDAPATNNLVPGSLTSNAGGSNRELQDLEETSPIFSPTSSRKPQRKAEKSRVEKLMEEQILASARLVTVTENLVNELKAMNQLRQKENELLYRLVTAKEEEVSYKRMKYN